MSPATAFDPIGQGLATTSANQITFNSISPASYNSLGLLEVKVKVRLSTQTVYHATEILFYVAIVDCVNESTATPLNPTISNGDTLYFRFTTAETFRQDVDFSEELQFSSTLAKKKCAVADYKISCTDNQKDLKALFPDSSYTAAPTQLTNVYS